MNDRFNTIAGWVLFAGIVALGGSILSSELFKSEHEVHGGYPIEGVEEAGSGAKAEEPFVVYMAKAEPAKGEQIFKKCTACHNADQGGANALGPNLWGVLGEPIGQGHGYAFSPALSGKGGTWTFDTLGEWLTSPKKFAPGTKMTFAGLGNPQDRADVIAFLNAHSGAPQPLPAAPPPSAAAADGAAKPDAAAADAAPKPGTGPNNGPQKAEDEPQTNEVRGGNAAPNGH